MQPPKCKFGCGQAHWSPICPKPPRPAAVKQQVKAIEAQPKPVPGTRKKKKKAKNAAKPKASPP